MRKGKWGGFEARRIRIGALFLAPISLIMLVFLIIPVFQTFWLSLRDWNGISAHSRYIGFANFAALAKSDSIRQTILNTLFLFSVGTILINALALGVSVALDQKGFINRNAFKVIFFLPTVLSPVVIALIWRAMYFTDWGVFDTILRYLGLSSLSRVWLGEPGVVMVSLSVAYVWYQIGTTMVIYLAGLQTIPVELYESAMMDGASAPRKFFSITIPMLAPAITINVLFAIVNALKTFDFPFALTEGGPEYFSRLVTLQIYFYAFRGIKYGLGTALSVVYTLFILLLSITLVKILGKREELQ
jgi:raffinose/stachyose/melibiose transport system permease protein